MVQVSTLNKCQSLETNTGGLDSSRSTVLIIMLYRLTIDPRVLSGGQIHRLASTA